MFKFLAMKFDLVGLRIDSFHLDLDGYKEVTFVYQRNRDHFLFELELFCLLYRIETRGALLTLV
jgi:hypothetical protein